MARRPKLKVFRTPIGFHDAYVAAPSQKAALAAWGADTDLFARGSAELVTDEELAREPLRKPGEVVRRLRGSTEEHMAALPKDPPRRKMPAKAGAGGAKCTGAAPAAKAGAKPLASRKPPAPRPSRAALEAAESSLKILVERQRREDDEIRERERRLRTERETLADSHSRELLEAERRVELERKRHSQALARWSDARP